VALAGTALAVAIALSLVLTLGGSEQLRSSPLTARIARELIDEKGASSAIVFVADGSRRYESTAAIEGLPVPKPDQLFAVGSVTKTFTATIVLQLAAKGKLRLNDTLESYLPGVVKGGDKITIWDLLRHQSGLANVTDYTDWLIAAASNPSLRPIDVLRFAVRKPRLFAPGKSWSYSNTNYIALGLIVERVSGHPYRYELEHRIIRPLGLRRTELPTASQLTDIPDASGYNPNVVWSAGGIVSDAEDLARFYSALLGGRLLPASAQAELKQTIDPMSSMIGVGARDGAGVFSYPYECGTGWGHEGLILDFRTLAVASAEGNRVAIILERGAIPIDQSMGSQLLCEKL